MWPFKRKQSENLDNVPTEVKEYYQAEQRERMGLAWLLAAITLVATVGIVLGLFLGGRVVYRHLAHKDKTSVATAPPLTKSPTKSVEKPQSSPKNTPKVTPPSSTKKVVVNPPVVTSTAKPPQASPKPTTITNTGPSGTTAVFIASSLVGTAFYQVILRRRAAE